jgi:hypothetical protein
MPTKSQLEQDMAELREMNRALLEKLGGVVAAEEKPVVFGVSPEQVVSEQVHNGMEVSFSGMVTLRKPYKAEEK